MTRLRPVWVWLLGIWGMLAACVPALMAQTAAPHDLQHVAEKPLFVFWTRPPEILKNPVLGELFKFASEAPPSSSDKVMLQNMTKIDSMRFSLGQGRTTWSPKPIPQSVTIYHTTDPTAASAIAKEFSVGKEEKTTPEWKSPIYTHKPFVPPGEQTDPNAWKLQSGVTQFDPQTVVQTDNIELMLKTVGAKPAASAWAADLVHPSLGQAQTLLLVDLAQIREMIKDVQGPPPGAGMEAMIFNSVKPLWESADYAYIKLDTTQGIQISAFAKSPNAESALRFKGAIEGLLAMGKGFMPMAKQGLGQLNQVMPGQGDQLYSDLEALVASIKVTQIETKTILTFGVPQETLARLMKSMMPAIQAARQAAEANVSRNNLKQIALALQNYHDVYRSFPPAVKLGKDGKTPHSWRVAILPFIEEDALYKQYNFDEPWDSENNKKVAAMIPQAYRSPKATNGQTCTNYAALTHTDGVFSATPAAKGIGFGQITDGTSQTIAVVETNAEIPWTKPEDLEIVDGQPLPTLGMPGAATFNVAFCDGSVHTFATKLTDEFRKLITKGDGQTVNVEEFEVGSPRQPPGGGFGPAEGAKAMPPRPVPAPPAPPPIEVPMLPPNIPAPPR